MLIVGNKCDSQEPTAVSTNEAQRFADSHNMPLFETSAKDDELANDAGEGKGGRWTNHFFANGREPCYFDYAKVIQGVAATG